MLEAVTGPRFHHQPEAQHPKSSAIHKLGRPITPSLPSIVLQNSQNAERLIFREKTKLATSADQCSLKPVTGIACEFDARRRSPPHNYSIVAPTARRI
jgi:hypothetical protein